MAFGVRLEGHHAHAMGEKAKRVQAVVGAHVEEHSRGRGSHQQGFVQRMQLGIVTVEPDRGDPRQGEVAAQREHERAPGELHPPVAGAEILPLNPDPLGPRLVGRVVALLRIARLRRCRRRRSGEERDSEKGEGQAAGETLGVL